MKTYPEASAFSRNMRARRRELNMSQNDLAKFCGLEGRNISNYERGYNNVPLDVAILIARALKSTVEDLSQEKEVNA